MEDEIFDEPRRCPKCNIVTYCDTCPICGRQLPRTPYTVWKLKNHNKVAGEQEELAQPDNYKIHQGHIQQREITNYHTKQRKSEETDLGEAHSQSSQRQSKRYANYRYPPKQGQQKAITNGKDMVKKISFTFAVAILILIVLITIGLSQYHDDTYQESVVSQIEDIQNHTEDIIVYDSSYHRNSKENVLSMKNTGNRSFSADLYLYDRYDDLIGVYQDLYVLPYEDFEITIYGDGAAQNYEFLNPEYYEVEVVEPTYSFTTFSNYGDIDVDTDKELNEDEAIELIRYLYIASSYSEYDTMYYCTISMPSGSNYSVYVDETSVDVYYHDKNGTMSDPFSFTLDQKTYDL